MQPTFTPSKYRRLVELGRGGMAAVHLAALSGPAGFHKLVVVKEMRPDLAQQDEFRRMFFEEARLAAQLNHPNVVQTYEVIEDQPGVYCIVMEFLDGQPLSRVIARARHEEMLPHTLYILGQVLDALQYVHEMKDFSGASLHLVHRDVSPHNVFLTYDGDVKLLDFGIAKTTGSSVQTEVGTLKGKVAYMAPEQAMGREVDPRADVFAAGVVLWEALTRKRIWDKMNNVTIIARLCAGEIPRIRSALPDVPPALEAICAKALAPDPAARFASAHEMKRALDAFAATLTTGSSRAMIGDLLASRFQDDRRVLRKTVEDILSGNARSGERFSLPASIPSAGLPTTVGPSLPPTGGGSGSVVGTTTDRHETGAPPKTSLVLIATMAAGGILLAVGLVAAFLHFRAPANVAGGKPPAVASTQVVVPSAAPAASSAASVPAPIDEAGADVPVSSAKKPPPLRPVPRGSAGRPPASPDDPNDVGF